MQYAFYGTATSEWLDRLDRERDNLRAALNLARDLGYPELELRLATALAGFWEYRGLLQEGLERIQEALDSMSAALEVLAGEEADADAAALTAQLARFTFFSGDPDRALQTVEVALETAEAPAALRTLPNITTLRRTWHQHYERTPGEGVERRVRFKTVRELPQTAEKIESPYDCEARYRTKRDTQWTGYMVHVTETCEPEEVHLLTHVQTTTAAVHEVRCTEAIHQALVDKELPPRDHVVDAADVHAGMDVGGLRSAHVLSPHDRGIGQPLERVDPQLCERPRAAAPAG